MDVCDSGRKILNAVMPAEIGRSWINWIHVLLFLAFLVLFRPKMVFAQQTVAVLPFRIYAMKPLEHLKQGLQEMLSLRLEKKGLRTIRPEVVNRHAKAFLDILEPEDILAMGREMQADWMIKGSLTQVGDRVSLDLEVFEVAKERPPFFIFMVADTIDTLADTVDRVAVSIDNRLAGVEQVDLVQVKGNQRIEQEAILAMVGTKKGDRLDFDKLDQDLRAVYGMGFFTDVAIETDNGPKGKIVTFRVSEQPSIGKIVFKGNKDIKEDDLKEQLGIKLYSIWDPNEIRQSINRLTEFYRQKGYYNVKIQERTESLPNNEVLVEYQIDEKEKVHIRKIEFVGNEAFDDDDLRDEMETSEKGFLSWITSSGVLDKRKLEFDVQKIAGFYSNQGFMKVKVGEPKVTYAEDEGLTVTIEIQEGPRYKVGDVSVEGELIETQEELLDRIKVRKGTYFNRESISRDIQTLRNVYADDGHAYAEVGAHRTEDDVAHLVDIIYRISKGPKVRFERINITGNTQTRDKVIRRELKAVEGEYFSAKAMSRSTLNLQRLGFFEDVQIQTQKGSSEDQMVLNVKVKERATGSFSIGAGYSSEDGMFGVFQVAQNNLFGRGQRLEGTVRLGTVSTQYNIKFVEPWLFDKRISAGLDIYDTEWEFDDYTKHSIGGGVTLGFPLYTPLEDFLTGSVGYNYDDSDISDVSPYAALEIKEMVGTNVTSSMNFGIRWDSRNKPFNTSEGSLDSLTFEYAGGPLGGDLDFNKYMLRSAWFFPLFWGTNVMLQGRWGFINGRGQNVPTYQKFRVGGINTVRGFDYGTISPRDPATGDYLGGEKMMVYNVEYRFPLVSEQGVIGLVFLDAGNVFTKDDPYTFSGIRKSAGLGIRWYSPMGPIRLEYGFNLEPKEDEPSGRFEFAFGGLF